MKHRDQTVCSALSIFFVFCFSAVFKMPGQPSAGYYNDPPPVATVKAISLSAKAQGLLYLFLPCQQEIKGN